ncbi:hypothetical protein Tco_0368229 [Tanacetum coccineum]
MSLVSKILWLTASQYGVSNMDMVPLPHHDMRHPWLRYQVEGYDEGITLDDRLSIVYTGDDGEALFTSHAWRRLFEVRGPLVREFMLEFFSTYRMSDTEMGLDVAERVIPDKGDLRDYWMEISFDRDFLGPAPSYVFIRDPVRRLCHMMIACSIFGRGHAHEKVTGVDIFYLRSMDRGTANVLYLLTQHLFRHAEGRKSGAKLSRGYFIGRLAAYFGLAVAAGSLGAAEDAPAADEGAQRIERLEEEVHELRQSVVGLRGVVESSITEQTRVSTWMISCMTQLMDASGRTY